MIHTFWVGRAAIITKPASWGHLRNNGSQTHHMKPIITTVTQQHFLLFIPGSAHLTGELTIINMRSHCRFCRLHYVFHWAAFLFRRNFGAGDVGEVVESRIGWHPYWFCDFHQIWHWPEFLLMWNSYRSKLWEIVGLRRCWCVEGRHYERIVRLSVVIGELLLRRKGEKRGI